MLLQLLPRPAESCLGCGQDLMASTYLVGTPLELDVLAGKLLF